MTASAFFNNKYFNVFGFGKSIELINSLPKSAKIKAMWPNMKPP